MRTEDAISSLKFIKRSFTGDCTTNTLVPISRVDVEALSMAIKSLEDQKTGHWNRVADLTNILVWECDKCKWQQQFWTNYCPDCGSKME